MQCRLSAVAQSIRQVRKQTALLHNPLVAVVVMLAPVPLVQMVVNIQQLFQSVALVVPGAPLAQCL
jgi:hypothetical protein